MRETKAWFTHLGFILSDFSLTSHVMTDHKHTYTKIYKIYKRIEVAYNNCFRKLMGYKFCTSASRMFLDNRVHHFSVLRRKSLCKFMNRLRLSDNSLVYAIYNANIMYCSSFYREFCQRLF